MAAKVRLTLARSNTVVLRGTINQEFGLTLCKEGSRIEGTLDFDSYDLGERF